MHWAVAQFHLTFISISPAQRMLHPFLVIALGKILARMRPAAFLARQGALYRHRRLHDEIVIFQRLDEIAVPDQ
jgi:hypothetical protein